MWAFIKRNYTLHAGVCNAEVPSAGGSEWGRAPGAPLLSSSSCPALRKHLIASGFWQGDGAALIYTMYILNILYIYMVYMVYINIYHVSIWRRCRNGSTALFLTHCSHPVNRLGQTNRAAGTKQSPELLQMHLPSASAWHGWEKKLFGSAFRAREIINKLIIY